MSPAQRLARQSGKRQALLAFLADETYIDPANAARLLRLSPDATRRTLRAMLRDRLLVTESVAYGAKSPRIFGIAPAGIAACTAAPPGAREHMLGRVSPHLLHHVLAAQAVRIAAEQAGWTGWTPSRALRRHGLRVVPDAVACDGEGRAVAVMLETMVLSTKRRAEIINALAAEASRGGGRWRLVLFIIDAEQLQTTAARIRDLYIAADERAGGAPFAFAGLAESLEGVL